jgi:hypothetical protein
MEPGILGMASMISCINGNMESIPSAALRGGVLSTPAWIFSAYARVELPFFVRGVLLFVPYLGSLRVSCDGVLASGTHAIPARCANQRSPGTLEVGWSRDTRRHVSDAPRTCLYKRIGVARGSACNAHHWCQTSRAASRERFWKLVPLEQHTLDRSIGMPTLDHTAVFAISAVKSS